MQALVCLFFILLQNVCCAEYYSQCGQDRFVHDRFFKNMRNGVFIDIGAHDGVRLSNTYFFEKELGWTGICFEPIPEVFEQLKNNRRSLCVQGCVSNENVDKLFLNVVGPSSMLSGILEKYEEPHLKRIQLEIAQLGGYCDYFNVHCYLLNDILEAEGISHVHFLSLDTEGGELDILKSIDFAKYQIDVITVENNYNDPRLLSVMQERGFLYVTNLEQDMVFVNRNAKFD